MTSLPAISGADLIKLLEKNGWIKKKQARHGVSLVKKVENKTLVTIVPTSPRSLPNGTLAAILGPKQTGIGREGLLAMLKVD